jgi:hypothetical protein
MKFDLRKTLVFALSIFVLTSACEERRRTRLAARQSGPSTNVGADASVASKDSGAISPMTDAGTIPAEVDAGMEMPPPMSGALIRGLSISEIAIYQGVKIRLAAEGEAVNPRNAPVVQGRDALLRVFLEPQSGWTSRLVRARLELRGSGFGVHELTKEKQVSSASSDSFLNSSINFDIPGSFMVADLTWSIALERTDTLEGSGQSDKARFPASGQAQMNADFTGDTLKIVLVPIQYNFDGSGRVAPTSPDQVERYRKGLYALFPTPEVEISIHEPFAWNSEVQAYGQGWSELLQGILNLRRSEGAARNVYYYGVVTPADSMARYCNRGCVAGLSTLSSNPGTDYVRGSIGLGFAGDNAVGTMVHEVGHAHGRRHAPCGLGQNQEADPEYPYAGGVLGVWGYDLNRKILIDPDEYKDLMSYCDPRWISDYQYRALFDRIAYVNRLAFHIPASNTSQEWTSIIIGMDGTPTWGTDVDADAAFGGERTQINFLAGGGQVQSLEDAHYFPFSHIPGGLLLLPKPAANVDSIRLANGRILARP